MLEVYLNMMRPTKFNNYNNDSSELLFKEHREFFIKYFELRTKFILQLAEIYTADSKQKYLELYTSLMALFDWTSNYIVKKEEFQKNLDELMNMINKLPAGRITNINIYKPTINKFREILHNMNEAHEKTEILPQKIVEQEDENRKFYREEKNDIALKMAKKAFHDMIINK